MINRPSFDQILDEMREMQERKGSDYGKAGDMLADLVSSKEFGIEPWINTILRINQKMHRLMSFARRGELFNESVEDSLIDMAVYAVHALRLYRESRAENQ